MNSEPEKELSAQEVWGSLASEHESEAVERLRSEAACFAPHWPYWVGRNIVMLSEAVALSLSVDPERVHNLKHDLDGLKQKYGFASVLDYNQRLAEASAEYSRPERRGGVAGRVDANSLGVSLSEFVVWAKSQSWTLPPELDLPSRQQISADVPSSTAAPPESAPLSNPDRQAALVGEELRAINAFRIVLIRSDQHGTTQTNIIAELMGDKSELPRGLSERPLQTIFAAARRGDEQVVGVDPQTVRNAMRVLCEHLLRGGKASVPVADVRKLFAETGQQISPLIESLITTEPQLR